MKNIGSVELRLKELGIVLSEGTAPVANYISVQRAGDILYLSGAGAFDEDEKPVYTGKVGQDVTLEQGYAAARLAAIALISNLKRELKNLDRVVKIVKVLGFVASDSGFYMQPAVINGASDLFVEIFGDKGRHARSAVGVSSLPLNLPVEVELIVQISDE